jgi:hypothetical protein
VNAIGYTVPFVGDKNVPELVVWLAKLCKYIKRLSHTL